jgi:hypothetical protein
MIPAVSMLTLTPSMVRGDSSWSIAAPRDAGKWKTEIDFEFRDVSFVRYKLRREFHNSIYFPKYLVIVAAAAVPVEVAEAEGGFEKGCSCCRLEQSHSEARAPLIFCIFHCRQLESRLCYMMGRVELFQKLLY